jgi:hypothetical protein
MADQATRQNPAVATLRSKAAPQDQAIHAHFNPSSLQYSVQSQQVEGQGGQQQTPQQSAQYVTKTTAKLTMDLIFDTTDTGENVCNITARIAQLMQPQAVEGDETARAAPPEVLFEWGDYAFAGLIEQLRETIDFFHPSGVPLRSTVNLTLTAQELRFEQGGATRASTQSGARELPAGSNPQRLAAAGRNPGAARAIAAQNGLESLRFSRGPLTVSATVRLKGPAGFAAGGAGLSAGAATGASFGGGASAGVAASAGAFAGLHASGGAGAKAGYSLDTRSLLPDNGTARLALGAGAGAGVGAGASFNAAGQASAAGGAGARVDLSADGQARIIFGDE